MTEIEMEREVTKSTCHWLPCSIDYDGYAPIHMYFQPELVESLSSNHGPITTDGSPTIEESKETENGKEKSVTDSMANIQAVSFRGRGLLANDANNTILPDGIVGSVMIPSSSLSPSSKKSKHFRSNNHNDEDYHGTVVMKENFDKVLQWEHESKMENLINVQEDVECKDVRRPGSVGKGIAMMEILRSVHDPIPVLEE